MENNNKKFHYIIISVLALVFVATITISSYAYFTATVTGTSNNNVVTTGTMEIEFSDGPQVGLDNIVPGSYIEKTFSVRNTGTVDTYYDIYMSDLINNFADKTDLVYTLTSSNGANISETQVPDVNTKIVQNQALAVGQTHNYTLRITFKETNDNQDDNKGKTFSTIIRINEVKDYVLPYTVISGDLDTVGSMVKIADEEFYVIGQEDENHVKLLSKWNLNVGDNKNTLVTEGIQHETIRGYQSDSTNYGTVPYANSNYWYDSTNNKLVDEYGGYFAERNQSYIYEFKDSEGNLIYPYVYTNNKINGNYIVSIAQYVDNYVLYLKNQGVNITGRLISIEELENLGCSTSQNKCDTSNEIVPEWITQTLYWTGSAGDDSNMWNVNNFPGVNLDFFDGGHIGNNSSLGVRPVIILEK